MSDDQVNQPQPVPMASPVDDSKKPWESKTVIISVILGLCTALAALIPSLSGIAAWINSHGVEIGVGWSVLAVVLRSVTKNAISLRD